MRSTLRPLPLAFTALGAAVLFLACSSSDGGGSGGGADAASTADGSTPGSSGASGTTTPDSAVAETGGSSGDSGAACNAVVQLGVINTVFATSAPAPTPAGGTIVDGTYVDMSGGVHGTGAPTGTTFDLPATTWQIKGNTIQAVMRATNGAVTRSTGTFTTTGTSLTSTQTCLSPPGPNGSFTVPYTATLGTLTIFFPAFGGTLVSVFVKK